MTKNPRSLIHSHGERVTLELAGEIDGSTAAEVCYKLQKLGVRDCTLDLSRVEAIDLFGARVLARGLKALRKRGVRFEVDGLSERVAGTLCLGGVLEAIV